MIRSRLVLSAWAVVLPAAVLAGHCTAAEDAPRPPLKINAFVFETALPDAAPIGLLEPGRRVPIVSWAGSGYWEICLDGMRGFIRNRDFAPDAAEAEMLKPMRGDDVDEQLADDVNVEPPSVAPASREDDEVRARRARYTARWGRDVAGLIMERAVWRGMSIRMARESVGRPDHVRKWGLAQMMHEEWRYEADNLLLVFQNGKLFSADDDKDLTDDE